MAKVWKILYWPKQWKNLIYKWRKIRLYTNWVHDHDKYIVREKCLVSFSINKFKDQVLCDVIPMTATHLLLGRTWMFDHRVTHDERTNIYMLSQGHIRFHFHPQKAIDDKGTFEMFETSRLTRKLSMHVPFPAPGFSPYPGWIKEQKEQILNSRMSYV